MRVPAGCSGVSAIAPSGCIIAPTSRAMTRVVGTHNERHTLDADARRTFGYLANSSVLERGIERVPELARIREGFVYS